MKVMLLFVLKNSLSEKNTKRKDYVHVNARTTMTIVPSVPDLCILFSLIIRVLVVVLCGGPKILPAHPFNALILPILRCCLQPFFY